MPLQQIASKKAAPKKAAPQKAALKKPEPADDRPRRGRPPLDKTERRARLMECAITLFTAQGYSETSVAEISQMAGLTKRTIYELIGDKDALFCAVCMELCARSSEFQIDVTDGPLPARRILMNIARSILAHSLAPQGVALNKIIAKESQRFPELMVSVMNVARVTLNKDIADVFARLMDEGYIARGTPSAVADVFYDTIVGNRPLRALLGYHEPMPSDAEINYRIDVFEHGCRPR